MPKRRATGGPYRRGKVWWVQWQGERRSLRTTDAKAAQAEWLAIQRRAADPTYRAPNQAETLIAEIDAWLDYQRHRERPRAEGTFEMYDAHVRHFDRLLGGDSPIAALDPPRIEAYFVARAKEGAGEGTRWKERCTLRGILKRAKKHGRWPFALEAVAGDGPPAYVALERHLLMPDVMRLLAVLPPHRAAMVAFIVLTGADLGSAVAAVAGDVDAARGIARVRGTKNTHRARVVPLLPPFAALVPLAVPPFERWGNPVAALEVACRRAGVARVTPRDLRRSHGRILRVAGVDPHLIGPMLGHAPGSPMTARTYAQLKDPAELAALIGARLVAVTPAVTVTPAVAVTLPARRGKARAARSARRVQRG